MDNIDNLEQNILELIMPELLARAGRIYIEDSEYKEAVEKADLIFDEISESLNDELAEKMEQYFTANNAAVAIQDRLVYQQGMQDLLSMLVAILKGDKHDHN